MIELNVWKWRKVENRSTLDSTHPWALTSKVYFKDSQWYSWCILSLSSHTLEPYNQLWRVSCWKSWIDCVEIHLWAYFTQFSWNVLFLFIWCVIRKIRKIHCCRAPPIENSLSFMSCKNHHLKQNLGLFSDGFNWQAQKYRFGILNKTCP